MPRDVRRKASRPAGCFVVPAVVAGLVATDQQDGRSRRIEGVAHALWFRTTCTRAGGCCRAMVQGHGVSHSAATRTAISRSAVIRPGSLLRKHEVTLGSISKAGEPSEMSDARYTKEGLIIPPKYLKGIAPNVRIRRAANVLIIESTEREAARKKLGRMVRALRGSAAKRRTPTTSEIRKLVRETKKTRAGRH